ncbi:hydrolase [Actinopolymorpha sp. B9G3]|uniref:hydrolase n=1 Tax=Actinopolymorpha sp. B9G3 TaxID=3158970 RepID=UPI0032D9793E
MTVWICATCAVEHSDTAQPPATCAICADERQYVLPVGQQWTSLDELAAAGHRVRVEAVEPDLFGVRVRPQVGIGQQAWLLRTPEGNLLWDPTGFVDAAGADRLRELGGVAAIAASHPHMFGVQVEWSRALSGVPVLVAAADRQWLQRTDPVVEYWSGTYDLFPGVTLVQCGGHFAGSAAAHWAGGADGRGVLLAGDTIAPTPDQRWASFMRSYPNNIPLSAAAVERVVGAVEPYDFDRLYGNFGGMVARDAKAAVRRSADRYIGWISGAFDADT